MPFKFFLLVVITIGILTVSCSNTEESTINNKDEQLQKLQTRVNELENKIQTFEQLSMNYVSYEEEKRFVEKEINTLALPVEGAPRLRTIPGNTVIEINDKVNVNKEIWYYVTVPVYDSPTNIKGWIREKDTVSYTKNNKKNVQSDVMIKEGTPYYETHDLSIIDSLEQTKSSQDKRGRLQKKKNGYAVVDCPGGQTVIVEEKNLIYPKTEN